MQVTVLSSFGFGRVIVEVFFTIYWRNTDNIRKAYFVRSTGEVIYWYYNLNEMRVWNLQPKNETILCLSSVNITFAYFKSHYFFHYTPTKDNYLK